MTPRLPGYVPFQEILEFVRYWRGFNPARVSAAMYCDPESEISVTHIARLLEPRLSSGDLQAAGLNSLGALYWVPVQAWRRTVVERGYNSEERVASACYATLHSGRITVPLGLPRYDAEFYAYLTVASLHEVFRLGASTVEFSMSTPEHLLDYPPPSPAPQLAKGSVEPDNEPALSLKVNGHPETWMRGYAQGLADCGKKAKREDAIKACMKALGCTYVVAKPAYEALPHPELRNSPRKTPNEE